MRHTFTKALPVLVLLLLSASELIDAAAVLNVHTRPIATLASYAVSTSNLENVSQAYAYRPWFETGAWTGDLVQYVISKSGQLSTSIDLTSNPPGNSITANGSTNWSARLQFNKKNSNYFKNQRKIITTSGAGSAATQIAFVWNALSLAQQNALDARAVNKTRSTVLDYIRGDQRNEVNNSPSGTLRQRYNLLGDIIHSDPVYVAAPNSVINETGYRLFKSQHRDRAARIYVGANDGMLHVFDARNGDEVYAYVPSMLMPNLKTLTNIPYNHQYYVDGGLAVGEMVSSSQQWQTILVGSLGAGGKGIFALNITNPNLTNQSSTNTIDTKILWELDGSNPDIGYIYDKAEIVKLPDGNWYVIIGNGYGSSSNTASLLLINSNGEIVTIEADNAIEDNGLSRPTLIDTNGDGAVDYAYAGDLQGNLYRFDLTNRLKATKVFRAGSNKPITTAPQITDHPFGGRLIVFGTGSLLSLSDSNEVAVQSLYGIRDFEKTQLITPSSLLIQTLSTDITITNPITTRTEAIRVIENPKPLDWTNYTGWQINLPAGERVIHTPNLRAGRFQVMTVNPVTQQAWLLQPNYNDGSATKPFYDLNNDGFFDANDTVNRALDLQDNFTGSGAIPMAIKQGAGVFSSVRIIRVSNGIDANFINGLQFPLKTVARVGNVRTGFAQGHIDVDTDSPAGGQTATNLADRYCYEQGNRAAGVVVDATGTTIPPSTNSAFQRLGRIPSNNANFRDGLSGATDGHQHIYDKAHGTVEVDYINLELNCKQNRVDKNGIAKIKLNRVTEVGIGNNTDFFVIIANADLSPGSTLNIGEQSWNSVIYQKLIQQKLEAWKSAGAKPGEFARIMVNKGKSLIYNLNEILATLTAGTGKLSSAFNDRAIIDGGLHPTQTKCVNKSSSITNGRWRNGALVMQLIDVNYYIQNPQFVLSQKPSDLAANIQINGNTISLKEPNGNSYGGLYANNNGSRDGIGSGNKAFLYESTLFWHFGTLYDFFNNKKPCYGETDWPAAKSLEMTGIAQGQLSDILADPSNVIGKANKDLNDAIKTQASADVIQALQNTLDKALSKIKDYVREPNTTNGPNTPTTANTPTNSKDTTVTDSNILGPNLTLGRRSWIDIRP